MTVNGTEDVALERDAISWRRHEDNVGRLRRRIFKAAQEEDLAKVRSLQKMMLRSWSNTLVSVRQVTQRNTGRKTAGIDGEIALSSPARMALAVRVHQSARTWNPLPVKRVYVPKANTSGRPRRVIARRSRSWQARAFSWAKNRPSISSREWSSTMRNSRARTEPCWRGQGTHGPISTSEIHRWFGRAASYRP